MMTTKISANTTIINSTRQDKIVVLPTKLLITPKIVSIIATSIRNPIPKNNNNIPSDALSFRISYLIISRTMSMYFDK